jgi:dihydrofolate synthase / folylpolyglutamate synthase
LDDSLSHALAQFEKLITRPAESFADPAQRSAEFTQRLERTRLLMQQMGNPQHDFRSIHITGTSGKGSIAIMCEAVLHAADVRVGTHTSPYLQTPLEKVRVDTKFISAAEAIALTGRVMQAVEALKVAHPTIGLPQYTEAWVAMALRHFADTDCEVGIVEVGMGGRYDSTNILLPEVSVISTVHYDHVRVLGDTLGEIAFHKAGIMKPGVPAVVGSLVPEAMQVIQEEAARIGSPLVLVGHDIHFEPGSLKHGRGLFSYRGLRLDLDDIEVGLTGPHQLENAAAALAALEVFAESQHIRIDEEAVRRGLASVRFAGRIEVMQRKPTVILDGAHNEEKIGALIETIRQVFHYDRLILVLAMLEAKTALPIVRGLAAVADVIITTAPDVKGKPAIPAEQLAQIAREAGAKDVRANGSPGEALQQAMRVASARDLIIVTGSLYMIGDVRSHWYSREEIINQRTMFPE